MKIAPRFSLLRQLVWAATLATGFGTVWFLFTLWLTSSIQEVWQGGEGLRPESLVVRLDGTPLIRSFPLDNLSETTYRDLNGQSQDVPDVRELLTGVYLSGQPEPRGFLSSEPGWEQRIQVFLNEQEPTVRWFFVHDGEPAGAGYFVGYERKSNRRVGFIGLSGLSPGPVPSNRRIPVREALITNGSRWSSAPTWISQGRAEMPRIGPLDLPPRLVYVPSGNLVRLVDLAARTVTTVFETAEPIESLAIASLHSFEVGHLTGEDPSEGGDPVGKDPILVRTRKQIYALDRKHNVARVFTIPPEIDPESGVYWYGIGNGQAIVHVSFARSNLEPDSITKEVLYKIADDRVVRERAEFTLQTGARMESQAFLQTQMLLGLPSPAFLFVFGPSETRISTMTTHRKQSYSDAYFAALRILWPSLLAVITLGSILAVFTWRRGRSFGLPERESVVWVIFVFLLGFPAFVGFLLHRRWPIRQPCPICDAPAPRDRAACVGCGSLFPDPSPKGIEIFA